MCCNPIRITNQGYRFHNFYSPLHIVVPCGHCWQCKLKRINDLSFRIMYECDSSKALPFFVTLTYKPEYLPTLYYYNEDQTHSFISCWNRSHVQRYFKNIRRQLQYYFGISKDAVKYYCTCERGSKDTYYDSKGKLRVATERPHYHLIFLLYCNDSVIPVRDLPSRFRQYALEYSLGMDISSFFRWLLHDKWFYGMVDDVALCRDLVSAVRYVTKYVCKDMGETLFFIKPDSNLVLKDPEYDGKVHQWYLNLRPYNPDSKSQRKKPHFMYNDVEYVEGSKLPKPIPFSSILPRPFGSINLGLSFLKNLTEDELLDYLTQKKKVTLCSAKSSTLMALPSYYYRKVCKCTYDLSDVSCLKHHVHDNGFVSFKKYIPYTRHVMKWDNENGITFSSVPSTFCKSYFTEIGLKVQRLKFYEYVKSLKSSLCYIGTNPSFYLDLYTNYCNLPIYFRRSGDTLFSDYECSGFIRFLQNHKLSFREVSQAVRLSNDNEFVGISSTVQVLINIIKFYQQCKFYLAHLQHLKHDFTYRQKLGSSAYDNPDLFINHFI